MEDKNIALLIDADNIGANYIENILSELVKYGKVTIRRMYGDWSKDRLKPWLENSSKYSLTPVMQSNDTPKKNASDIGLVIDAMDILYAGQVDGFCIVSSDSDFNKLAKRLRESGNMIIGMGEKKTPESFRASCEKFIFLDILENDEETSQENGSKKETVFTEKSVIEKTILEMLLDSGSNRMYLGEVGNRLNNMFSDFDVRNYNYSKLSEFIIEFDNFSLKNENGKYWVILNDFSIKNINNTIIKLYKDKGINEMNIGELKKELSKLIPNINFLIKQSGVTKFSTFLEKKVDIIAVEKNNAKLKAKS